MQIAIQVDAMKKNGPSTGACLPSVPRARRCTVCAENPVGVGGHVRPYLTPGTDQTLPAVFILLFFMELHPLMPGLPFPWLRGVSVARPPFQWSSVSGLFPSPCHHPAGPGGDHVTTMFPDQPATESCWSAHSGTQGRGPVLSWLPWFPSH